MSSVHGQLMGWMLRAMGGQDLKNLGSGFSTMGILSLCTPWNKESTGSKIDIEEWKECSEKFEKLSCNIHVSMNHFDNLREKYGESMITLSRFIYSIAFFDGALCNNSVVAAWVMTEFVECHCLVWFDPVCIVFWLCSCSSSAYCTPGTKVAVPMDKVFVTPGQEFSTRHRLTST